MLGLAEQVGGHQHGVGGLVGDDGHLATARPAGRSRPARTAAASPRRRRRCPRRRACRPARRRAGRRPSRPAPARRRAGRRGRRRRRARRRAPRGWRAPSGCGGVQASTSATPADLRHAHGHEGAGGQREAAGRQVGADALHGDVAVAGRRGRGSSSVSKSCRRRAARTAKAACAGPPARWPRAGRRAGRRRWPRRRRRSSSTSRPSKRSRSRGVATGRRPCRRSRSWTSMSETWR